MKWYYSTSLTPSMHDALNELQVLRTSLASCHVNSKQPAEPAQQNKCIAQQQHKHPALRSCRQHGVVPRAFAKPGALTAALPNAAVRGKLLHFSSISYHLTTVPVILFLICTSRLSHFHSRLLQYAGTDVSRAA